MKWVTGILFLIFLAVGLLYINREMNKTMTIASNPAIAEAAVPPTTSVPASGAPSATGIQTNTGTKTGQIFEEGKHYQRLSAKITTHKDVQEFIANDPGKIQVIEFFNYGCYWCQLLHPVLTEWAKTKPDNVVFYRYPVVFNKLWESLGKVYLVIKTLGKTDEVDKLFFTEIHQKQVNLADEKLLKPFLTKINIPEAKFFELYNSFAITTEMAKINNLGNAYQITLSPSVIINTPSGSYLSTATMAGSDQALIQLMNYLITRDAQHPQQSNAQQ